jgi:hypothetical protein
MSAFIVNDKHLDVIVNFAVDHDASFYWDNTQHLHQQQECQRDRANPA